MYLTNVSEIVLMSGETTAVLGKKENILPDFGTLGRKRDR
jgi:hypothetical protein